MENEKAPSERDVRLLQQADEALALGEPRTREETQEQLDIVRCGMIALQALNDLGSSAANDLAAENLVALQAKYDRLREAQGEREVAPGRGYALGRHRD